MDVVGSNTFVENVTVEVTAALAAAAILGIVGFLASRRLWRTLRDRARAALIRKATDAAFTIIRCPIANDDAGTIGSEIGIRLETAFRAFAGWDGDKTRPFQVVQFPLKLPSDQSTRDYDRAVETAKRWLSKTNGDILIWGKRVKGESTGFIRLVGKNRANGIIEARRVDFDKQASNFDDALATAIAYEAAELTQATLSEPTLSDLNSLRSVSVKLQNLAEATAPALSDEWRARMATEHRRLVDEIARRTPDPEGLMRFEQEARTELSNINRLEQPLHFAEIALRVAILVRKRNWPDPNRAELNEATNLLKLAAPILESSGLTDRAVDCALERLLVRRQELVFLSREEAETDSVYRELFREANRLISADRLDAQRSRLTSLSYCYPPIKELTEIDGFEADNATAIFRLIDHVETYLDNEELLDLANSITSAAGREGDRLQSATLWRAEVQLLDTVVGLRTSWTKDEQRYLKAMIASNCSQCAQRVRRLFGNDLARPYYDRVDRLAKELSNSFDWHNPGELRLIDFRTLTHFQFDLPSENRTYLHEREIVALRICAGPSTRRFPRLHRDARKALAASLNNLAVERRSLEAAQEAFDCLSQLDTKGQWDDAYIAYVAAFSAWQIALLTSGRIADKREEQALRAHIMAHEASNKAMQRNDQLLISLSHEVLQEIEGNFPELALDLDRAALATDHI